MKEAEEEEGEAAVLLGSSWSQVGGLTEILHRRRLRRNICVTVSLNLRRFHRLSVSE